MAGPIDQAPREFTFELLNLHLERSITIRYAEIKSIEVWERNATRYARTKS